ncbi:MAG TPA: hypothetical protein IAB51_00760 [Candidatus Merdivicinus excrementipullorum]|uniref:Uncharacterized protein n=1 Tax=Candidatus Merdivicinus excrementipullorum TaxID=2840867 RepID=A0A9D1FK29_9FIRM|nr:hypothetical protein [Candidatus Merdivicinus excrementipullorum]
MESKNLKKGLFGFQQASVFQYISDIEETFSAKLMEKDAQAQKNEEQYLLKIRRLEEELSDVREQFEKQKNQQVMIANTLLDAQRYAETLKKETEEKEQEARRKLTEQIERKQQEINAYQMQIQQIREMFHALLSKMDGETQELEQDAQTVKDNCPGQNMSLFLRRNESAE